MVNIIWKSRRFLSMREPYTKQAIAEDIKREVLKELNLGPYQRSNLVDCIKNEVLMELQQYHHGQFPQRAMSFVDEIKNEVLTAIQRESGANLRSYSEQYYPNRAAIVESVKREVLTQLEVQRQTREQGEIYEPEQGTRSKQDHHIPDPSLIQAVKNSVIAEMNLPTYR
jgi:hypothetical protein